MSGNPPPRVVDLIGYVLIAAVANIALPEWILLTGEGMRLAEVGWDRPQESVKEDRNPDAWNSMFDCSTMAQSSGLELQLQ